jgi:hypothetical protein
MDNEIKITADIIDYLGKYEDGVLILLSVCYNDKFTEGTLYYSDKMLALTVDEDIENDIGPIELWPGYKDLLISIFKRAIPYNEIINRLDDVDFEQYFGDVDDDSIKGEDIDEDDIETV